MYERELEVIAAASRQRVGPATSLVNDAIRVAPSELAAKAGFSPAVYAVGRLVHSEYGFGPPAALLAIAEAARNEAARRGVDVVKKFAVDGVMGVIGHPFVPYIVVLVALLRSL